MTLNGVIALILLYFTELSGSFRAHCVEVVDDVVVKSSRSLFHVLMSFLGYRLQNGSPMLSDHNLFACPVCAVACLSVTLAYCGQTVGWIRMPLGAEVASARATLC